MEPCWNSESLPGQGRSSFFLPGWHGCTAFLWLCFQMYPFRVKEGWHPTGCDRRPKKPKHIPVKTNHLAFTLISCTDWLLVSLSQCADVGYHLSLGRVIKAYLSRRWRAQENLGTGLQQLKGAVSELDQIQDRDTFLQDNYATFSMPLRFTYQPHDGDQVCVHG